MRLVGGRLGLIVWCLFVLGARRGRRGVGGVRKISLIGDAFYYLDYTAAPMGPGYRGRWLARWLASSRFLVMYLRSGGWLVGDTYLVSGVRH